MKIVNFLILSVFAFTALAVVPGGTVHSIRSKQLALVSVAHADDAAPVAAVSPAPVSSSVVATIGEDVSNIAAKIPLEGVIVTVLVFVYDAVRRRWPTAKPADLLRDIGTLLKGLAALFAKLGQLLDKILGQNVA